MKYLPFINGAYSVAPGLIPFSRTDFAPYNLCLHIDEDYLRYIANKEECRKENLEKYHPGFQVADEMMKPLLDFLLEKMIAENPDSFEIFEGDKFKGL